MSKEDKNVVREKVRTYLKAEKRAMELQRKLSDVMKCRIL